MPLFFPRERRVEKTDAPGTVKYPTTSCKILVFASVGTRYHWHIASLHKRGGHAASENTLFTHFFAFMHGNSVTSSNTIAMSNKYGIFPAAT